MALRSGIVSGLITGPFSGVDSLHLPVAPALQAIGTPQASLTAITCGWPPHVPGDIGLAVYSSGGTEPVTLATANGFAALPNSPQDTLVLPTSGVAISAFWRRATSSAMASPVTADSGNHQHGFIVTFRGCIGNGNPYDASGGDILNATLSTSVTVPSITTTVQGCLVVIVVGHTVDDVEGTPQFSLWTNANLTSLTEQFDASTNQGAGSGIGLVTGIKQSAGATGTTTATLGTQSRQARYIVALKGLGA